jgi:hypothetical protein
LEWANEGEEMEQVEPDHGHDHGRDRDHVHELFRGEA